MSAGREPAGARERLAALADANRATLDAIRAGTAAWPGHPYYGYYLADIFDCPPFAMFTNNDCPRAINILYGRTFEPGSMALWCRHARTATSIFDIGAHVGVYALAAASLRPDIKIHAFEPNPFASARLRLHKEFNGFENIVEGRMALAHKNTVTPFFWGTEKRLIPSGASISKSAVGVQEQAYVQLATLDSLDIGPVGDRCLMKIDVEGAEALVFAGMAGHLAARPDIILETFSQQKCDAINELILPLGYNVYLIREDTGALEPQDRLTARTIESGDFNQFLTTRTHP
ncbi:MAG: FkbM family methyltransferase [Rhodospirillaceae bacterium]